MVVPARGAIGGERESHESMVEYFRGKLPGAVLIRHGAWRIGQASVDHPKDSCLTSRVLGAGRARLLNVASGSLCGASLPTGSALCEWTLARRRPLSGMLVLAIALALPGCASNEPARVLVRNDVLLHVRLVDHIDYKPGTQAFGLTRCTKNVCVVEILRDRYPLCLQHEIRHVFEGDWHGSRETLEGC